MTFAARAARLFVLVAALVSGDAALAGPPQRFATPDEAVAALLAAGRANDVEAMSRIYGDAYTSKLATRDRQSSEELNSELVEAADEALLIEEEADDRVSVLIGADAFPLPIPLVKKRGRWEFDYAAGEEELTNRLIGLNELMTISALEDLERLQVAYDAAPRGDSPVRQYARRVVSTPGKHDGLYWPPADGEPPSPIGPLFAETPESYYGYVYRILTRQGPQAPGGAYDYIINGNMVAGYAAIAWPLHYGRTGIQTFIVGRDGIVYQKDLGPQTADVAAGIDAYDPDPSWIPARGEDDSDTDEDAP